MTRLVTVYLKPRAPLVAARFRGAPPAGLIARYSPTIRAKPARHRRKLARRPRGSLREWSRPHPSPFISMQSRVPFFLAGHDLVDDHGTTRGDRFLHGRAAGFADEEMTLEHESRQLVAPADYLEFPLRRPTGRFDRTAQLLRRGPPLR